MRTLRAWGMLMAMCVFAFALSGCGGGSLDGNVGDDTGPNPVSVPDTYSTQEVLKGSWSAINSLYEFEAAKFGFRLNSARLTFDYISLTQSIGEALVTSNHEWYADYTSGDKVFDLGVQDLGLSFDKEAGRMIHQEKDKWRCNVDTESGNKLLMNIAISSDKIIRVNYQGVTPVLFNGEAAEYNFTLNFRKEE